MKIVNNLIKLKNGIATTTGGIILNDIIHDNKAPLPFKLNLANAYAAGIPTTKEIIMLKNVTIKLFIKLYKLPFVNNILS